MRRFALLLCLLLLPAVVRAQNALPVLPSGDAAVAGFSGTVVIGSPPPPENRRIDKTYINLDGPSLRVIGLSAMGGPPQAQLVPAPKPFTATARQIGQVFSLALDNADPPNIYAAATSAYGLPIVVPDTDGDGVPDRSRKGAPNAAFMPGLFGPITMDGGPGSIWKIDGRTGAVSLFANVALRGVPNSGPALGGLAFDPGSRQLFVADRDTGMIHRFTLDGVDRGQFDHGTQTLAAAGLPPIAFDPRKRLNIESPAFDTGNPATWAYAPPARRVFGLAVSRGRLYYAVAAGLRIWSVSLLPDGSFGSDPRFEVTVPRTAQPGAEISEILFDDNGDMLVAERGAPTGAYDYKALAEAGENRVLRFRPKRPDDPPSRDLWFPVPREYAIGFPPNFRNDNGGIALGYSYDAAGNINRAVCGGMLWSTGEQLRNAKDPAIIRRLQPGGPLIVDGLQGNSTELLRPKNEPPFATYFIDYDDRFDDPQTRGYLGDVVIWRVCGRAALPLVPVVLICPLGLFNVDGVCRFPTTCPAGTEFSNGCCVYRDCPPSYVRIRGRCVPPPMNCGEGETYSEGSCQAPKCPAGMVLNRTLAATVPDQPQTSNGCGPGEVYSNSKERCEPAPGGGQPKMCSGGSYCKCPEGTRRNEDGTCKQSSCGPHMVDQGGECVCDLKSGYQGVVKNGSYTCVQIAQCDQSPAQCCESGWQWSPATHTCVPPPPSQCNPSDPTTMVKKGGQCVCRDGSSGGQSGGSSPVPGLADQNCCPADRKFNVVTNKCDPDDPGPKLKIVKTGSCTSSRDCLFVITITNQGPGTFTGPILFTDNGGANFGDIQFVPPPAGQPAGVQPRMGQTNCTAGGGNVNCNTGPQSIIAGNSIQIAISGSYPSGTPRYNNCAALGTAAPVAGGPLSDDVSCVNGDIPPPSNLKITKTLKDCCTAPGTSTIRCSFSVSVTNTGSVPFNGPIEYSDSDPNAVGDFSNGSAGSPITLDPGQTKELGTLPKNYTPGTRYSNCAALVPPPAHELDPVPPPDRSRVPSPDISCISGNVPVQAPQCPRIAAAPIPACPDGRPRNSDGSCPVPPPTITVGCPLGMRMGSNGQCFFVDPGCRGPNCVPVNTGCAGNVARNSDGNCPTPPTATGCTGGKQLNDDACRCPYGQIEDKKGNCQNCPGGTHYNGNICVPNTRRPQAKKTKTLKPDDTRPSIPPPQFNIQIGPGFPGGGGGGHRSPTPTRPMPPNRSQG